MQTLALPSPAFIPQDILDTLEQREENFSSKKHLVVEGWRLQSPRRARAEITKIAKRYSIPLLDEKEAKPLRKWARDNYHPGDPIDDNWHPAVQVECPENEQRGADRLK